MSRRVETAWRDARQGFAFKARPRTVRADDVDCADVADLTDPASYAGLGVDAGALTCPWEGQASRGLEPPSRAPARRLFAARTAAIVVPSFAPGATPAERTVVFWQWSEAVPHRVTVIDDAARLPRDDASWA